VRWITSNRLRGTISEAQLNLNRAHLAFSSLDFIDTSSPNRESCCNSLRSAWRLNSPSMAAGASRSISRMMWRWSRSSHCTV